MAMTINSPVPDDREKQKKAQNSDTAVYENQLFGNDPKYVPLSSVMDKGKDIVSKSTDITPGAKLSKMSAPANPNPNPNANTSTMDTTGWSSHDAALPDEAKTIIGQAKTEYQQAAARNDVAGMKAAYKKSQEARAKYGNYIDNTGDGMGYQSFGEETWSAADRNLPAEAKGMLSEARRLWALAETDADKQYAHDMAEKARKMGGYSGGADGSQYNPLGILDLDYNDTSKYESQYQDKINGILGDLENAKFSYDYNTDPSYKAYADAFERAGNSAAETGLAQTAAATGGIPSSYAAAVANQARQQYAKKTSDMIPTLEEAAYNRYMGNLSNMKDILNQYNTMDGQAYDRFANDRNFNFGQWQANYGNAYQKDYDDKQLAWLREQIEKQLADADRERQWQTGENALDRAMR